MSILEELTEYCNDRITGKRIACKKEIYACQRFLRDVKNQNTPRRVQLHHVHAGYAAGGE